MIEGLREAVRIACIASDKYECLVVRRAVLALARDLRRRMRQIELSEHLQADLLTTQLKGIEHGSEDSVRINPDQCTTCDREQRTAFANGSVGIGYPTRTQREAVDVT